MSEYTIKNLKEVEDAAPNFGLSPNLEARFARKALECEQTGLAYERLAPNVRTGFGHKHENQEEIYVVVGGGGRVKIEDDIRDVSRWDAIRVGPGTMREFEAGPDGIELIAFGAPAIGENDAELVPGWWSD
ncbi:MAG TPA: hypothetical protein VGJ77_15275 [Gaiellaceae bacterium]|jgi:mannose-6-phosphate isomerase-like protein (cupin superfamily)